VACARLHEGEFAPDLAEVARFTGLTPTWSSPCTAAPGFTSHVRFSPGFRTGDLPQALALPRRADPRLRVPAGSISIATSLTAIYPYESPGGWHLIGATPIRLFDADRPRPALFAPGDAITFEAIDPGSFAAIRQAVESRIYEVESAPLDA
jgi:KipI family sensor histidine kinase inhibitor